MRFSHVLGVCVTALSMTAAAQETFSGVVFRDADRNGVRDEGEAGIPDVSVSNGVQVVRTDVEGRYTLPHRDEMVVFVSKPADYALPVDENQVPQFFYVHQPQGSPDFIEEYEGLEPTGALPESVDFPLIPAQSPNSFSFVAFGDLQPYTPEELTWVRDTAVADLLDSDAHFAVAVGDLVGDALDLYPRLQQVMGALPFVTYYLPGNHDLNFDAPNDRYSVETYKRHFGAPYYSFDYGQAHFVLFDNIVWQDEGYENSYNGRLSDEQLRWFANDLKHVDPDKLIVLSMHAALSNYIDRDSPQHQESNRERVYEILAEGGFDNVISLAGHSHTLERMRPGETYNPGTLTNDEGEQEESFGWGTVPFAQYVVGAVSGNWWSGPRDEFGVPTSYQRSGAPRGYMVFEIDGTGYREHYKVSGSDEVMHLTLVSGSPENQRQHDLRGSVPQAQAEGAILLASVYAGSRDTQVTLQINEGQRLAMTWDKVRQDPLPPLQRPVTEARARRSYPDGPRYRPLWSGMD
jgi:3',5'-cyclic AMP phosphodiesterase CpdA